MSKRARANRGAWSKGQSGNPKGGPRNTLTLPELSIAVREVEKKQRKTLVKHFVERAFINDQLLLGLFKKFIPDLASFDAFLAVCDDRLDDETTKGIRSKLIERFKLCH
jgi:hypothetical protein